MLSILMPKKVELQHLCVWWLGGLLVNQENVELAKLFIFSSLVYLLFDALIAFLV